MPHQLTMALNEAGNVATLSFYCPDCKELASRRAILSVIRLLEPFIEPYRWQPPAEMTEERQWPPISHDEVLEFHNRLHGRRSDVFRRKRPAQR
jgi:hypothetical protein